MSLLDTVVKRRGNFCLVGQSDNGCPRGESPWTVHNASYHTVAACTSREAAEAALRLLSL